MEFKIEITKTDSDLFEWVLYEKGEYIGKGWEKSSEKCAYAAGRYLSVYLENNCGGIRSNYGIIR